MSIEATTGPDVRGPVFDLLPGIFRDCVDPEDHRYSLGLPFVRGEWAYATDGCIIVRTRATPSVIALLPIGDRRVPRCEGIFDDAVEYAPEAVAFEVDEPAECPGCDGRRHIPERRCDECDGDGETACPCCRQDRKCPECGGKGTFPAGPCRDCSGTGYDFDGASYDHAVAFANGTTLGQKYAWLLEQHDARVFLPVRRQTRTVTDPVKFAVAGDVEGFVMPLTPVRKERP